MIIAGNSCYSLWQAVGILLAHLIFISSKPLMNTASTSVASKQMTMPVQVHCQPIPRFQWQEAARKHQLALDGLLFPPQAVGGMSGAGTIAKSGASINKYTVANDLKARMHAVRDHPIYNFLHTYYRYSYQELRRYSPGYGSQSLDDVTISDTDEYISAKFLKLNPSLKLATYDPTPEIAANTKLHSLFQRNFEILTQTSLRQPHFGCFGFHEWAMLYSGRCGGADSVPNPPHQPQLGLRVSQETIDEVVERAGALTCTHFDAWRFFQTAAQDRNLHRNLTRSSQTSFEQPGCIHATMDLFKYAYQLHPLLPSPLLIQCLEVALHARLIDMRASPYDVSRYFDHGSDAGSNSSSHLSPFIAVETVEGRKQYAEEQEALFARSMPVRLELHQCYERVLAQTQTWSNQL